MAQGDGGTSPTQHAAIEALDLLSGKWHPIVLQTLREREPLGFNALLESIQDVSGKVLSDALEELGEAGLVDRTVVTESPLRVEYERTRAGRDMEPVFDELAAWSERYLDRTPPTVLLADGDPRLTEMFAGWLGDRFAVVRAHDGDAVLDHLLDRPDVLLVERSLPGADAASLIERAHPDCRTVLVLGERPDLDLLDVECDDVLRKPVVRDAAVEAIETQLERVGQSPEERERAALRARWSLLESVHSREFLEGTMEYFEASRSLESLDAHRGRRSPPES